MLLPVDVAAGAERELAGSDGGELPADDRGVRVRGDRPAGLQGAGRAVLLGGGPGLLHQPSGGGHDLLPVPHGRQVPLKARYDPFTNGYTVDDRPKSFMYFPYLFHPNLHKYSQVAFFRMLRDNDIYFDIKNKKGASFLLVDETTCGVLR